MKNTTNKLPVYTFSSFTEDMVVTAFGLEQELKAEGYLTNWLQQAEKESIEAKELEQLTYLNEKLKLYVRTWNEQELREKFISPMVELVDFE